MATTSISGEQGVRFASAVATRPATLPPTDSMGLERFSIPLDEPEAAPIPASRGAAEPKAAIREGGAAKTVATASLASSITEPGLPVSDLVKLAKATIPSSPPSADNVAGRNGEGAETRLPRARKDEDQATPPSETGLGGFPWLNHQPAGAVAMPVSESARTPQVPSSQDGSHAPSPIGAGALPQMAQQDGKAGLSSLDGAGPSPTPSPQAGRENPVSAETAGTPSRQAVQTPGSQTWRVGSSPVQARQGQVPDALPGQASLPATGNGGLAASRAQAGNAPPPSAMVQAAAIAPVQAIVSEAAEAKAITTAEEPSEEAAVPVDGIVPNPVGTAILALTPPESVAFPPAGNAPAMANQAAAAPPPNPGEIVSHGTGASKAAAGRSAAIPVLGTDRSASSERETLSVKAFGESASDSAMAADDLASVPAAPFGLAPAAHLPAPALESAGVLPQTQAQAAPVPLGAVPMTIGLRSLAGSNRFEISLDPKDLGRIDVNLDIDKESGTVTAHLTVDRPETLALLQRDVGNLQQALSQAGFDAGDAGINLSLRSDTGSTGGNGAERDGGGAREGRSGNPGSDLKDPRLSNDAVPLRMLRGLGGLDIRI